MIGIIDYGINDTSELTKALTQLKKPDRVLKKKLSIKLDNGKNRTFRSKDDPHN